MSSFRVGDEVWSSCWIPFAVRKEKTKVEEATQSTRIPPDTGGVVVSVFENGCVCDFLLEVEGEGGVFFTTTVLDNYIKKPALVSA